MSGPDIYMVLFAVLALISYLFLRYRNKKTWANYSRALRYIITAGVILALLIVIWFIISFFIK